MSRNSIPNILAGLILISLGLAFGMIQILDFDFWGFAWPFAVIGVGGVFLLVALVGGKSIAGLAVPGSVISTIGGILLYQNAFGHWESWAYAWPLIVAAVGIGIWLSGLIGGQQEPRRAGLRLAGFGLVLFLFFAAFFEIGFGFQGVYRSGGVIWPLVLIGVGVYLVLFRSGLFSRKSLPGSSPEKPA